MSARAGRRCDCKPIVDKHETNSFAGTALADLVPAPAEVVVVAMQSEYCVRDTALAATRFGHSVSLVRGAHATYDDERSAAEITRNVEQELERAGVAVIEVADVRFSRAAAATINWCPRLVALAPESHPTDSVRTGAPASVPTL